MFYLQELNIEKYYLLNEPVHLTFDPKVNYLTGKNGSGKSTLLELIRCVCSLKLDEIEGNGEDIEFTAMFGNTKYDIVATIKYERWVETMSYGEILDKSAEDYYDKLNDTFESKTSKFEINYIFSYPAQREAVIRIISDEFNKLTFLENNKEPAYHNINPDSAPRSILLGLRKNKINISLDFITWLDKNGSRNRFTEDLSDSKDQILKSSFISDSLKNSAGGGDHILHNTCLIEPAIIMNTAISIKENTEYFGFSSSESALLKSICNELSFKAIRLNYHLDSYHKDTYPFEDGSDEIIARIQFKASLNLIIITLHNDVEIKFEDLSYGEKRYLIARFYWITNRSLRLVDEPVNGLHHNLIENFMGWVEKSECQVFIANQNPVLFDFIHFRDDESFRSQMTFCKNENHHISWEKPSDGQVKSFMKDYRKQFLNVSTIMKFQELW